MTERRDFGPLVGCAIVLVCFAAGAAIVVLAVRGVTLLVLWWR